MKPRQRLSLVALFLLAACGSEAPAARFEGVFTGTRNGIISRAELAQEGANLRGRVLASGGEIALQGIVDGERAEGTLSAMGHVTPFHAVATAAGFELTLMGSEPHSGRTIEEVIVFRRAGGRGSADSGPDEPTAGGDDHDPQLVGAWKRTESFGGGYDGITAAMEEFLVLRADGTLTSGTGRFVGGGAGIGFESGGGETQSGRWRVVDSVVHVAGQGGWVPFARYYVEGGRLMLTFGDGSRQVWHRAG